VLKSRYSRILFAVDDDEALFAAERLVGAWARRWDAEVRVLHVRRMDPSVPDTATRRLVDAVVDRLRASGVGSEGEIHVAQLGESVGAVVARAAAHAEADLIAIGSHGRSDLGVLLLGSVSQAVASESLAPVLVLTAPFAWSDEPRTVLVAVDGLAASDEAAAEAAGVAERFGAAVHVYHARRTDAAAAEPEEAAEAVVRRAVAIVERHGARAIGEITVEHSIANGILRAAERNGADLVVLGSRRPSTLDSLVVGSVAHDVLPRLRCPVLLARRVRTRVPIEGQSTGAPRLK